MRHRMRLVGVYTLISVTLIFCAGIVGVQFFPQSTYTILIAVKVPEALIAHIYNEDPHILFLLGDRHLGGDGVYDLESAERYYSRAIELDEKRPFLHYQRARIYFLTMRYRDAIDEVNKEILYNPDFSRSYYLRGLVYGYDRKLPEAAADFTEFIQREPEEWAGYNDLAWILFQLGDYEGVKEAMEAILPRTQNAWLYNAYGVALLNLGMLEEARSAFEEAQVMASRMTPESWGIAYIGNDPAVYPAGLEDMRKNIDENIKLVNNRLSPKEELLY